MMTDPQIIMIWVCRVMVSGLRRQPNWRDMAYIRLFSYTPPYIRDLFYKLAGGLSNRYGSPCG